jgi:cell division protein FtsB
MSKLDEIFLDIEWLINQANKVEELKETIVIYENGWESHVRQIAELEEENKKLKGKIKFYEKTLKYYADRGFQYARDALE